MSSGDILGAWEPSTAQRRVRDAVAEIFEVEPYKLVGRSRQKPLVHHRHTAIWVVHQCFPYLSRPMLGRLFGNRDHSTIIHALRNIEYRRGRDAEYRDLTDLIVSELGGERASWQVTDTMRERVGAVCSRVRERRNAGQAAAEQNLVIEQKPADVRNVLPRNDFSENDPGAAMRAAGSKALLSALQREGMVCL